MNFLSKKLVFMVLIPLIGNIINEVNSFYIMSDAWTSIKNGFNKVRSRMNCFGIHDTIFELLSLNETKEQDIKFYFASQNQPVSKTVTMRNNTFSLDGIDFKPHRKTVLIAHGFLSSGKEEWVKNMMGAFLKYCNCNVIVVDWEEGSNTWNYMKAAVSTRVVGDEIAKLFNLIKREMLKRYTRPSYGKIHFVGHSLGAHIVARAANRIKKSQRRKSEKKKWIVSRITGLDPAQPCFIRANKNEKLDVEDADYVDIIHTNAENRLFIGLGMPEQIGHIDFYPNGGKMQIGCESIDTSFWSHLRIPVDQIKEAICSHGRSHQFYIESIIDFVSKNCSFYSHRWEYQENDANRLVRETCRESHCPEMGIKSVESRKRGIFFTPTGHEAPYCVVKEIDKELITAQLQPKVSMTRSMMGRFWSFLAGEK